MTVAESRQWRPAPGGSATALSPRVPEDMEPGAGLGAEFEEANEVSVTPVCF